LHPTQASRGLAQVKTEHIAGRQQVRGVSKTAYQASTPRRGFNVTVGCCHYNAQR